MSGRARTADHEGYRFNFGPHALYRGGVGVPILRDLGLTWTGEAPPTAGYGVDGGRCERLPTGLFGFLGTKLLPAAAKAELLGLLPRLVRLDPEPLRSIAVQDWLDREVRHAEQNAEAAVVAASLPGGGVLAAEVRTFAFYTGGVPSAPSMAAGWIAGAQRGWFARALWAALDSYRGTGGNLPEGDPTGGNVP